MNDTHQEDHLDVCQSRLRGAEFCASDSHGKLRDQLCEASLTSAGGLCLFSCQSFLKASNGQA